MSSLFLLRGREKQIRITVSHAHHSRSRHAFVGGEMWLLGLMSWAVSIRDNGPWIRASTLPHVSIFWPSGSKFDVHWCVCCSVLPNWFIGPSPNSVIGVSTLFRPLLLLFLFVFCSQLFLYSLLLESKLAYLMRQCCGFNCHSHLYTASIWNSALL